MGQNRARNVWSFLFELDTLGKYMGTVVEGRGEEGGRQRVGNFLREGKIMNVIKGKKEAL